MPVIDKLKSMLGGGEEETFTYECQDCGKVFESSEAARSRASCPDCPDSGIVSAPHKSPD